MDFYTINESDPISKQPNGIVKINLYLHQKMSLYKMLEIENTEKFDYTGEHLKYSFDDEKLTNYSGTLGILSDRPGSGKSITLLSLILSKPYVEPRIIKDLTAIGNLFSYSFENLEYKNKIDNRIQLCSNLIIIPTTLKKQWLNYIVEYTELSFMTFFGYSDFEEEDKMIDIFTKHDVIIISAEVYQYLGNLPTKINFSRLVIDEADTLKIEGISKVEMPTANFYWIISSSINNVMRQKSNTGKQFCKQLIRGFPTSMTIFNTIVVKNDPDIIDKSICLPKPIIETFTVKDPYFMKAIGRFFDDETTVLINSGNIDAAIERLNIGQATITNIVGMLSHNLNTQLRNLELELDYKISRTYASESNKAKTIEETEKAIKILKVKIEDLSNRIKEIDDCPICMYDFKNPCIIKCCAKKFCFLCIHKWIKQKNSCPSCKTGIDETSLINILETEKTDIEFTDKVECFMNVFNKLPSNSKVIVFSNESIFFHDITKKIKGKNVWYGKLTETNSVNSGKTIENFKTSDLKSVLFLNSRAFATGINLQFATNIITLDKVTEETKIQIHGRVLRPGLNHTPIFTNIFYENEM